ncbi:MAG TPA: superoxide dismutase [Cu-Zn] SodC [Eoetvoesiella sp.]
MKLASAILTACAGLCLTGLAHADITVQMHEVNDKGNANAIGTVVISESKYGLVFEPELNGLAAGLHGFHVHEKPSCEPENKDGKVTPAGAAGGHLDPQKTGKHGLPWGDGHLGDLPALYVEASGKASNPVLAPRLKTLSQVQGHALMIHKGGDNHSDQPQPLGGGGARIACGVIK